MDNNKVKNRHVIGVAVTCFHLLIIVLVIFGSFISFSKTRKVVNVEQEVSLEHLTIAEPTISQPVERHQENIKKTTQTLIEPVKQIPTEPKPTVIRKPNPIANKPKITTKPKIKLANVNDILKDLNQTKTVYQQQPRPRVNMSALDRKLENIKNSQATKIKPTNNRVQKAHGKKIVTSDVDGKLASFWASDRLPGSRQQYRNCTARVSITIAATGKVISYKLIKKSGNNQFDAAVYRALSKLKSVNNPTRNKYTVAYTFTI